MSDLPAPRPRGAPDHVVVVGAGAVGLATAYFLLDAGIRVTVLERNRIGAGASWGNAGWLTPGLATPLPEPAVLRYGLRALFSPSSPVYVPLAADPLLGRFLSGFVRNCTTSRFRAAARALSPLTRHALEAFDALTAAGVAVPARSATPFVAAFAHASQRRGLLDELAEVRAAGQPVDAEVMDGARAREVAPLLSERIGAAVLLHGQRFLDPGRFVDALADTVRDRGGVIRENVNVVSIADGGTHVRVTTTADDHRDSQGTDVQQADVQQADVQQFGVQRFDVDRLGVQRLGAERFGAERFGVERFDAAVVANGAWLPALARSFGVRLPVQAGRGYSLSVPSDPPPTGPLYFPAARLACTPIAGRLRLAGTMEFRGPDAPADPRRIAAMIAAARPLLRGVDLAAGTQTWVGPRPCTPDGLPLIGRTTSPRVFVAGGHGMWGITLGPVTGRLLADLVVSGRPAAELAPFDPLRRRRAPS